MANICTWILKAKCPDMQDADILAAAILGLAGQGVVVGSVSIKEVKNEGYVLIKTRGECDWNLQASGLFSHLKSFCHNSKLGDIEVFAEDSTKFNEDGSVHSDTYKEHLLLGMQGEATVHSFRKHIPNYGKFRFQG